MSLMARVFLLIFCIDVSGLLKSTTCIVSLSISPFVPTNTCFMYLGVHILNSYIFTMVIYYFWNDQVIIM